MNEPPALPEPIKPPRGDFSLEERKWREGVTRAINTLTDALAGKADAFTKGNLRSDSTSYITVSGGDNAVIGSGVTISFNASNLPKLNGNNSFTGSNTFTGSNSFTSELRANAITLNGSDLETILATIPAAANNGSYAIKINSATKGTVYANGTGTNTIDLGSYLPLSGGTLTGTLTMKAHIIPDGNYSLGSSGAAFYEGWITYLKTNQLKTLSGSGSISVQTNLVPDSTSRNLGGASNHWGAVYTNNLILGNCAIYHVTDTNDIQIGWTSGGARAVYFTGMTCRPYADNTLYLGVANYKWKAVYSNTGTIQTSDAEQKENLNKVESGLKTLNSLNVYSFNWKGDEAKRGEEKNTFYGIVAQEALEKAPELVDVPTDYQKGEGTLGVYVSNVLFLAVRAIQELSEKISKLEESYGNNTKDR